MPNMTFKVQSDNIRVWSNRTWFLAERKIKVPYSSRPFAQRVSFNSYYRHCSCDASLKGRSAVYKAEASPFKIFFLNFLGCSFMENRRYTYLRKFYIRGEDWLFSREVVDEISSKPTKHIEVLRILLLVQMICYSNLLHRLTSYQSIII